MKTIMLGVLLCATANASILPTSLFSGDADGWNNYQPGASDSSNSPNITLSNAQAGLVLPDGVTAVSFSALANVTNGTTIAYVDQWQTIGTTSITMDWWSSGPTTIWFDGGVVGILADLTGTGENSGTINLTETDGYHYFAAFVTASGGKNSFAYTLRDPPNVAGEGQVSAPEPATFGFALGGIGIAIFLRRRARR